MNPGAIFKKLVDFLLIFLLVFFTLQFFNNDNEKAVDPNGKVLITTNKDSYSIPASVDLMITNNSPEDVTLNTCENIQLSSSGDIIALPSTQCEDITVVSNTKQTLNYGADYNSFASA